MEDKDNDRVNTERKVAPRTTRNMPCTYVRGIKAYISSILVVLMQVTCEGGIFKGIFMVKNKKDILLIRIYLIEIISVIIAITLLFLIDKYTNTSWQDLSNSVAIILALGIPFLMLSYLIIIGKIKRPENRRSKYDKILFSIFVIISLISLILNIIWTNIEFILFFLFISILLTSMLYSIFNDNL